MWQPVGAEVYLTYLESQARRFVFQRFLAPGEGASYLFHARNAFFRAVAVGQLYSNRLEHRIGSVSNFVFKAV